MTETFSAQIIPFPVRQPAPAVILDGNGLIAGDLTTALHAQHLALEKWNQALAELAIVMRGLHGHSGMPIA